MEESTEKYVGVVEDPRSEEEKSFDYSHEELAGADKPLNWVEKPKEQWKGYIVRNQDGSLSCVAHGTAKMLGIHEVKEGRTYVDLAPKFIYTRRANYPDGGMWLPNALDIACKWGACLETMLPCENKGESWLNDKSQETPDCVSNAAQFKGKNYFEIKSKDIDAIASVIEQGYPVLMGFRFDYDEWDNVPHLNPNSKLQCGHGIAGIDYTLYNGEKAIIIEDSWGPNHGVGGHRVITETFLKARCFYVGYCTSLIKEEDKKFTYTYYFVDYMSFQNKLKTNKIDDVKALQTCLQSIGLFPKNAKIDGIYGAITRKAVKDFQVKYVGTDNNGVQVGPKTLAKLNEMFDN